nr:DUF859 family phage minor structural protein [Clostridia bacterium]
MATTVSYSASMRTRKTNSASNYKASAASQEYYDDSYNFVGIVHFSGLSLLNKVITGISLRVSASEAGYGAGTSKTVYVRKSKYQAASQSGVTGGNYYGDALGTFSGSFYGNTTSYTFSGSLFDNLAAYFQQGNNTICLFNPSPQASSQGYSRNYLQWESATITITYEEGVSQPSVSASSIDLGSSVTISTNRLSTSSTHTLSYSFGGASGTIATGVGDSVAWTPPISLAAQIPVATSGQCTITCYTYYSGVLTGTKTCTITLIVPTSVAPAISAVNYSEAVAGIAAQFAGYVQNKSKLAVSIAASGAQGSTITAYRATLGGSTYTAATFTTGLLSASGNNTLSVTVTDSRGRTAITTRTITVLAYIPPSLSLFKAERCNTAGTAPQTDGTRVRISATAGASSVNSKNTMSCVVYYKLSSASTWTQATTITPSNYAIASTNLLLSQTFDALSSFDLMIRVTDFFHVVEQAVSIGTKQVMMDFYRNGTGIAFGKVAETAGAVEMGWPIILSEPLGVAQGGTGSDNGTGACNNLGAVKKAGDTMTGNLSIQSSLYPSVYLLPTYSGTTNRTVFEGSYVGAGSFAAWEDSTGNNRRMLEVRTAAYAPSMDNAVLLRTAV